MTEAKCISYTYEPIGECPNGINQHDPGAKLDKGKVRLSLVFTGMPRAIWKVAEVLTYGAQKYSANGWKQVENGEERYFDAHLRHLLKDCAAPDSLDHESMILHKAHRLCNDMFELELMLRRSGFELENQ